MSRDLSMGDFVRIRTGKLDANASSKEGEYPFFTCSETPLKIKTYSYDCECVLVAGNGDLNVKYYKGKFDAYQRTYIIETIDSNILTVTYIYRFLEKYIEKLRKQSIGGVIKYIKIENLKKAIINIPSIKVQNEITAIFDNLDSIILKTKEILYNLDSLIQFRFIEMFGDPVSNSYGFPEKVLSKLGELGRGVSKHRPRNDPKLLGGKYPFIQTGDVSASDLYINSYTRTYSELGFNQSKMWNKETLCITIAANIAKTAILAFDACFPDSVVGFVSNEKTNNVFIHYWFNFFQTILELQAPESAQKNINLKILSELKVIVPPLSLQNEFADFVKEVDKSKLAVKKSLEELEILKKSLMQKYFS